MIYLATLLTLALIFGTIWWSFKNWNKDRKKLVVAANLFTLGVTLFISWYLFPVFANMVIYRTLILNIFYIVPSIVGLAIFWYLGVNPWFNSNQGTAQSIIYVLAGAIIMTGGTWLLPSMERWQAAQYYAPTVIDSEISVQKDAVRYTPLQVVYQYMENTITSSKYTVEEEFLDPVHVDGGFGYIAPVTPDGPYQTFVAKVDGAVIYNDDPMIPEEERLRRVNQRFEYGEGMEWQDDINRTLYRTDTLAKYGEIYYLQLDPLNPNRLTAVAPKIKYKYKLPIFWVPVWGGVTLVHDDGTVEDLSVEEVMKDDRFDGKMVFPSELARYMVEVQIFDQGFIGGFINREGKIDIPDLPGNNQMPFLFIGEDSTPYAIVSTEPSGGSSAMFRQFYIDLTNGEMSYFEYDASKGALGPRAAIEYVKSALPGRKWVETGDKSGESGDFRVIEPRPLTTQGELFWLTTITSRGYTGITSTAIVNAASKQVTEFESRCEFDMWLSRSSSPQTPSCSIDQPMTSNTDGSPSIERVEALLEEALREIELLKQQ